MNYKLEGRDILYNNDQLGPYPDQLLKRVDQPTNMIPGETPQRKAQGDAATARVDKGGKKANDIKNPRPGRSEPIFQSILGVRQYLKQVQKDPNPVAPQKAPIPDDPRVRARHLKSYCYFLGADLVGICGIPEYAVFKDGPDKQPIGLDYKYAIVIVQRKSSGTAAASNGYDRIFNSLSHMNYSHLMLWSESLGNYIRRLGFDAQTSNIMNYYTVMPSLLLAAGIGESGRIGICVSPFFGPNFKCAAVMTNMELEPDKPVDFGLQEYCKNCGICAEVCISGCIPKSNEQIIYNGYRKYNLDYPKCPEVAVKISEKNVGSICGRCANMCPWNRPDVGPEFYRNWDGDLEFLYKSVNERAQYLRECHFVTEEQKTRKWWFELYTDQDKNLAIPPNAKYTILD